MPRYIYDSSLGGKMSIVVICEKPSQGRDIARILGATKSQEGYLEGNGYCVTWCVGHLLMLAPPEDYRPDIKPWRLEALPVIPETWKYLPNPKTSKQLNVIKKILKTTDHVWIATDADREGDVIGREILDYCHYKGKIERLWLSALDDASIKKAIADIKPDSFSRSLYQAGLGRSMSDWLIGMNLSMATTVKFSQGAGVLSVGRVQSPTLKLVVDRDKKIEQFKSQEYYEIHVQVKTVKNEPFVAKWLVPEAVADEHQHCLKKEVAQAILDNLASDPDQKLMVEDFSEEKKQTKSPLGLSLSQLQKLCSAQFGFGAKKTLEIAQSLYETHKATTYPRTDSAYLPESQYADAKIIIPQLLEKSIFDTIAIDDIDFTKKSSIWNDKKITAHHAIIPTMNNHVSIASMTENEKKVYELIARYYLAQFMEDYHYVIREVILSFRSDKFKAKSHTANKMGWKALFTKDAATENEDNVNNEEGDEIISPQSIPYLEKNDSCKYQSGKILTKLTQPPPRFTEGTLITAMKNIAQYLDDLDAKKILKETAGIGTEATRANIIETLLKREYFERKGKQLISTQKGRKLIELLPEIVTNPLLTAKWESYLEDIVQNKATLEAFMQEQVTLLRDMLTSYDQTACAIIQKSSSHEKCTKCSKPLMRRKGKFGFFWGCTGYPDCKEIYKDNKGKPLFEKDDYGCPECQEGYLKVRSGKKGKFWGCDQYPQCKTIILDKRGKPERYREIIARCPTNDK